MPSSKILKDEKMTTDKKSLVKPVSVPLEKRESCEKINQKINDLLEETAKLKVNSLI